MSAWHQIRKHLYPETEKLPDTWIPQFRLEGRSRDPDNEDNLAMRIVDPYWTLGRQWQFGEFIGEDNGSPISVEVKYRKVASKERKSIFLLGKTLPGRPPLEAVVEAQKKPLDLKTKIQLSQKLRRIAVKYLSAEEVKDQFEELRRFNPLYFPRFMTEDKSTRRLYERFKDREIDVFLFLDGSAFSAYEETVPNPNPLMEAVFEEFHTYLRRTYYDDGSRYHSFAWNEKELGYKFQLRNFGSNEKRSNIHLHAPDYQSGNLDWYSFDRADIPEEDWEEAERHTYGPHLPINLTFNGMPDKRLFSFEDGAIDLGNMDIGTDDLVRLLMVDFAMVTGSDWFLAPLEMKLGELCWVDAVEVQDVFGVKTLIKNGYDPGLNKQVGPQLSGDPLKSWDVFKIRNNYPSQYHPKDHFLFLAPRVYHGQESSPLEELLLLRDEYANMVWALEKKVLNGRGEAVDGAALHRERYGELKPPAPGTEEEIPRYRLAKAVPSHWIPYLPVQVDDFQLELKRGIMVRNDEDEAPRDMPALSLLSKAVDRIREEAIPRSGRLLQLTRRRTRWVDGETYVWMGIQVRNGKGEGDSGLRFDYLM